MRTECERNDSKYRQSKDYQWDHLPHFDDSFGLTRIESALLDPELHIRLSVRGDLVRHALIDAHVVDKQALW